ncbi:MAG: DUF5658 family protein [Pseudomonadota bacterium]
MTYYLLTALVILLQIGDMMTTMYVLNHGGHEVNPAMVWLFSKVGVLTGLILKVVILSGLAIVVMLFSPMGLIAMAVIYVGIVGWNSYQVFIAVNQK